MSPYKPYGHIGYRLYASILSLRTEVWVLGTMVFALHRDAQCQDTIDESVESVLAIPIRMRASS